MRKSVLEAGNQEEEDEINLTPMLDVVFIMLIFFIVTASFVKESGATIERPIADTTSREKTANILVGINSKDEIWIDRKKVTRDGIRASIAKIRAENPEGAVMVQADKDSHAEVMMAVLDAAREEKVPAFISAKRD